VLYHLLTPLRAEWAAFNLFRYVTFRAAFAAITAFVLALLVGGPLIRWLQRQRVREDTTKKYSPKLQALHGEKKSTPTMGGLLILGVVLVSTLLWARLDNIYVLVGIGLTLALGAVGFCDDWVKLKRPKADGIKGRTKLAAVTMIGLSVAGLLYLKITGDQSRELLTLQLPFFKNAQLDLSAAMGLGYLCLVTLVLTASSNAVNLTDGLDGLAIGCVTIAAGTLAIYSYVVGRVDYTAYLHLQHVPGAAEMAILASALIGGGLGFLWFNCFPAQVFMGDTGSLPLGGLLGYIAVVTRQELMLMLIGGIFVIEAVSVILQVGSFKLRGQRVLRCAPLHHHYEFGGMAEAKVTVRFWIVAVILAVFSVASLKLR